MFFTFTLLFIALLKLGEAQPQWAKNYHRELVSKINLTATTLEVQELVKSKAAKDDIQILGQNTTAEYERLMNSIDLYQNTTLKELVRLLSDKETKEDAQIRASEFSKALNLSIETGNEQIMDTLLRIITSQEHIKNAIDALKDTLNFNPTDQCVTRNEVESTVQSQVQSLVDYVAEIQQNNTAILLKSIHQGSEHYPAASCAYIPQWRPSGLYWIQGRDGSASQQYCDMTRTCCGRTGGWMEVANLDMKDTSQQCPSGFRLVTSPRRSCGRPGPAGCVSTTFPVHGVEYSRVCGKIIGYQDSSTDAFARYFHRQTTLEGQYVDGVSLTHGSSPRNHIWTFAAALDETRSDQYVCPCTHPDLTYTGRIPPFIGQDYFCETGSHNHYQLKIYSDDPLWDGQGCGPQSTCCSFNNPPWFCKELPQPTSDDIELRLCASQTTSDEDILLETVEIYIQ